MNSYHRLQHSKQRFESPAKVFAKLKSRVVHRGDGTFSDVTETHGAVFKSPWKKAPSTGMHDELRGNQRPAFYRDEALALTLSPPSSPKHTLFWSDTLNEVGHGGTPRKRAFLESTTMSSVMDNQTQQPGHTTSPSRLCSPMRLRKRKLPQRDLNRVSSCPNGGTGEPTSSASSVFSEDLGDMKAFSAGLSERNRFTFEPGFPSPSSSAKTHDTLEKLHVMSPAKMFNLMKQRESRVKQQDMVRKVCREMVDLIDPAHLHQTRDMSPPSTAHTSETEDGGVSQLPGGRGADLQSYTDVSEDLPNAAVPPQQPVLLIDPVVLRTPQISIPKKQEAMFKRNKRTQIMKFPSESVIHLKKWFLRKNSKGLYVDGIHQHDDIPWNSNIIKERISNRVIKTVSGRVYILVDKMNIRTDSGLPKWLLKQFTNGFPPNWEALYERWVSESTGHPIRETERKSKSRGAESRTKSEASTINRPVRQSRQNSVKSDSWTPSPPSARTTVSRSGRVIKPPLEYWKGGRVILDAQMNVTIHEGYDTSTYQPKTTLSAKPSQKPSRVVQSCSEVKLRRLVVPLNKCSVAKSKPEEKSPVEERHSPERWCDRATRSSQRSRATQRMPYKEPEKPSKSKKQIPETTRPSARDFSRKKVKPAPPKSVSDGVTEKKKEVNRRRRRRATNESQLSEFSRSDEDFKKDPETQTKPRQRKSKLSPVLAQSSSKKGKAVKAKTPFPGEHDAEEWTEEELHKLQEAVSYFPKHTASYWAMVAAMVGTRSAEECHRQQTGAPNPPKRTKKPSKQPVAAAKRPADQLISAGVGTFKRKQQMRHFLEAMPRDDVDDVFNSPRMQSKRFEMPSMCPSDQDFTMSDMQPLTPISAGFPEVKTPQCLHITPGMMGSPNRNNGDKYVHQLQKRMKKNQFNVCKQAPPLKSFTPTPSVQRKARRCGTTENDTFVVWEMFPELDAASADSREEEDFYFTDSD